MILRRIVLALVISGLLAGSLWYGSTRLHPAYGQSLGDILVIGGVILVVSTFGDQINNFINDTLRQNQVELAGASKVVPIFSVGQGAYIGAAQVIGLPVNVRQTQGVASVNVSIGNLTGSALVPITTRRPSGGTGLNRVSGVGVSAVIDFRL